MLSFLMQKSLYQSLHCLLGQSGTGNHPDISSLPYFLICAILFGYTYKNIKNGESMSAWLIILTGLIYAYIACEQAYKGNYAMSVVYSGYAFSNVGLYLLATK